MSGPEQHDSAQINAANEAGETTNSGASSAQETLQSNLSGLPYALGAYLIWGFLPLYFVFVKSVPSFEFVAWRIIWTLPFCLLIVVLRRQGQEVLAALRDRKVFKLLCLSAILIAINWVVYVWAIQHGHFYAASLGYYINPLLNVVMGTMILGERLNPRKKWAVGLATLAVAILAAGALTTLWISLCLALCFATYGLIRKRASVGSLPGLTIESTLLLIPSSLVALAYAMEPAGSSFGKDPTITLFIMLGGVLTAVPLLLFAIAARKMEYSQLGFIQFLAPTIVFLLGLFVFEEPLNPAQLVAFLLIWSAQALFVWDLLSQRRRAAQ